MIKQIIFAFFCFWCFVFSTEAQTLKELVVEESSEGVPRVFTECGSTELGVLVFKSAIEKLQFKLNLPTRLVSENYDQQRNEYILCVQPTDRQYIITITSQGYEAYDHIVRNIKPNVAQYFTINPKETGGGGVGASAEENNILAENAFNHGNFAEAERYMRFSVEKEPNNPVFLRRLAITLIQQKKHADAVPILQRAINVRPKDAEMHHLLGTIYNEQKKYEDAASSFKNAVDLAPNNTQYRIDLQRALEIITPVSESLSAQTTDKGQIAFNATYSSSITTTNPSERYTVVLGIPGKLSVKITNSGGQTALPSQAANVRWFDAEGTLMKASNGGISFPYNDVMELAAGAYYIEIVGRGGAGQTGTYNIEAVCSVNERKPNTTRTNAMLLPFGYTVNGSITAQVTRGMYKYVLPEPGKLTVNVNRGTVGNVDVRWYNAEGKQIKGNPPRSGTGSGSVSIVYRHAGQTNSFNENMDLEAGTYYIEIAQSSGTGSYTLRGDFTAAGSNETEPNNDRTTAQLLASGQTIRGFISHQDNIDMFRYVLPASGRFTVIVDKGTVGGVDVRWYNAEGTLIKGNPPKTGSGSVYIEYRHAGQTNFYNESLDLEAGTYFIEIAQVSGTGTYTLRGDFIAAGNNDIEPNNDRATAQFLASGQTIRGFISHQDNIDMFRYVLPQPDRFTVIVDKGTVGGVDVRWYNAEGTLIRGNPPRSGSSTISFSYSRAGQTNYYNESMDLQAGTYYIEIAQSSGTGTYFLTAHTGTNAPPVTVSGVSIYPSRISMQKGITQAFTATVTGRSVASAQGVTWSVSGNNMRGTTISDSGELTIAADETAPTLTVRATSTTNRYVFGTVTVVVRGEVAF